MAELRLDVVIGCYASQQKKAIISSDDGQPGFLVFQSGSSSIRRRRDDADAANIDGDVENLKMRH